MNTNFSYDRMDYYSILEYLKEQASYFSDGSWTDFSDGDLGTVLLKLMAMNADTTNFQVEKGISELYLDTVRERVNAIALCKLVGYEPRHYLSASVEVVCSVDDLTLGSVIPAYSAFSDNKGSVYYFNIEDIPITTGLNRFRAYQGRVRQLTIDAADIDERGRYYLPDYVVGTNTFLIQQAGATFKHIDNALYGEGDLCYSIHIDLSNSLYIQFPTYYETVIATNTPINIRYLLTDGVDGRIGKGILEGTLRLGDNISIPYTNEYSSEGGFNPESVDDIRRNAPSYAKTMDTLVTLNDFRILANEYEGISDVVALDYNFPESGLVQPSEEGDVNDAYKVNIYMLLEESDTIVKDDEEIDESKGEYVNESNFVVNNTQNLIFNEANQTFVTRGADSVLSGKLTSIEDVLEILIKYSVEGEVTDELIVDYSDSYHNTFVGGNEGIIRIEKDLLIDGGNLSLYFDNNSNSGVATFSIFLVKQESDVLSTVYKEQVQKYMDDVKKKKPAGIQVNYFDVKYIRPHIVMNVYMDDEDLRFKTTSGAIGGFLESSYSRANRKIGEAVYTSHIFKEILDKFDYIKYLEITSVEYSVGGAIKPNNTQFVELLSKNITVNVLPYEGE